MARTPVKSVEKEEVVEPTPIIIADQQKPVAVIVEPASLADFNKSMTVSKGEGLTLHPTTTEESDRVTAGQRYVNRLWEHTQAAIAITVTFTTCFVLAYLTIISVQNNIELTANALLLVGYLVVMATSIITAYFTRTNHEKTGGIGPKAEGYTGR